MFNIHLGKWITAGFGIVSLYFAFFHKRGHKKSVTRHGSIPGERCYDMYNPPSSDSCDEDFEPGPTCGVGTPYKIESTPRGLVYVFNYINFAPNEKLKVRRGAELDSQNIRETFSKMGYEVTIYEDLNQSVTEERLDEIATNPRLQQVDALILFFLSHGKDSNIFHTRDCIPKTTDSYSECEGIDIRTIRKKFNNASCPYMKNKPKILFTSYCRGGKVEKYEIDGNDFVRIYVPKDLVTINATTEGVAARREIHGGTTFIKTLCQVLEIHASDELRDIYMRLNDKVMQEKGPTACWEDSRFRKFYFIPRA
ncbi:hypothetical protein SK128_005078 [Halocaridina rubra]|uniref:Uncharacterized protein n=1 Tax=Halocaridina rubra TaxID=373956 RepID=A0AAN8WQC0_HALRR